MNKIVQKIAASLGLVMLAFTVAPNVFAASATLSCVQSTPMSGGNFVCTYKGSLPEAHLDDMKFFSSVSDCSGSWLSGSLSSALTYVKNISSFDGHVGEVVSVENSTNTDHGCISATLTAYQDFSISGLSTGVSTAVSGWATAMEPLVLIVVAAALGLWGVRLVFGLVTSMIKARGERQKLARAHAFVDANIEGYRNWEKDNY
jgi:hypothetical protein